ncbi:MAG: SUMF1/EgtB/PvdO family nonheme iron enzyme [Blastocatellales bacterium]
MHCAACNLSYPDHLSFCRRCGQPLARSASDPVMDTICCTRCGARTVKGEKFCQQCGSGVGAGAQETVVGACYHCGTSWRSGWLFCKTCGLDRDHALLLPTSMPGAPSSARTLSGAAEEMTEIVKVFCKRCGAAAKPYSRFCETCGNTIGLPKEAAEEELAESEVKGAVITGKLAAPPAAPAFRTQTDSPSSRLQTPPSDYGQYPTVIEPLADGAGGGRKTIAINDSLTANFPDETDGLASRPTNPNPETVITTLPMNAPDAAPFGAEQSIQQSDSRGSTVVWMIIIVLTVAAAGVAWRLLNNQKGANRPADSPVSQAADQSTAQTITASPEALPSAAPGPEQPAGPAIPAIPDGMVFVPGGDFKMGRDDGDEFESPAHAVNVKPFYIDQLEVTNEEYQRFVSATGHRAPTHWINGKIPDGQTKFPVVNVSWDDANAYARWANKRLPTEPEWELAARGTDGRVYPWGNVWRQNYANAGRGKEGDLVETGRYESGASPFGALDMCGNAWEWTSSDFKDYPGRKVASSLAGAGLKVIRGGAYDVAAKRATTTYRGGISPDRIPDKTGFRCVRDAQ